MVLRMVCRHAVRVVGSQAVHAVVHAAVRAFKHHAHLLAALVLGAGAHRVQIGHGALDLFKYGNGIRRGEELAARHVRHHRRGMRRDHLWLVLVPRPHQKRQP